MKMGQMYPNPSTAKVDCSVPSTHKSRDALMDTLGLEFHPSSVIRYAS